MVKEFEENDTSESDTPRKLAQLKVDVILVRDRAVEWQLGSKGHVGLVRGFEANDTAESDVIRIGRRQLVSLTPRDLAKLKVEVILVRDLAWKLAQHEAKVVLLWNRARVAPPKVEVILVRDLARKLV